ncbi:MAG: hypothetical protein ABMA00_10280 [Gemmatimonas sp.]
MLQHARQGQRVVSEQNAATTSARDAIQLIEHAFGLGPDPNDRQPRGAFTNLRRFKAYRRWGDGWQGLHGDGDQGVGNSFVWDLEIARCVTDEVVDSREGP